ncbi:hypothetical protein ALC62_15547 [Cyphomyrmex costatus]|uniref:Uncharacterized protein n=1 Tax=Cyphomyrmex costatus TaxID=456900 RepID=A0A195C0Z9_9HYME|nr:hypothetical protein ALC62_15547 [Cyphomyrmex costatus]
MKCLSNIRGDCVPVLAAKRTNGKNQAKGDETHLLLNVVPRRLENQARVSTFKHPPVHVRLSTCNQNLVNVETELELVSCCKVKIVDSIPFRGQGLLGKVENSKIDGGAAPLTAESQGKTRRYCLKINGAECREKTTKLVGGVSRGGR